LPVRVTRRSSARGLARTTAAAPEDAARQFIDAHRDLWNLSTPDLETVQIRSVSWKGLPTVPPHSTGERRPMSSITDMTVALDGANQVVSVTGQLFAAPTSLLREASPRSARRRSRKRLRPPRAILTNHLSMPKSSCSTRAARVPSSITLLPRDVPKSGPASIREVRTEVRHVSARRRQFASGYYIELWIHGYPPFAYVLARSRRLTFCSGRTSAREPSDTASTTTGDALHRPEGRAGAGNAASDRRPRMGFKQRRWTRNW
jgi:hypothetical protein